MGISIIDMWSYLPEHRFIDGHYCQDIDAACTKQNGTYPALRWNKEAQMELNTEALPHPTFG